MQLGTLPMCQPPGSPPNVHHAQVVLRHARASTARVGSPQGQGRGGQQSKCSRRLPPSSNTLMYARSPPTHSYTHERHSGCACKAPTLSVASSMRRCAWPSALRGMQGLELTPSRVPLSRPVAGPVGGWVGRWVGAGGNREGVGGTCSTQRKQRHGALLPPQKHSLLPSQHTRLRVPLPQRRRRPAPSMVASASLAYGLSQPSSPLARPPPSPLTQSTRGSCTNVSITLGGKGGEERTEWSSAAYVFVWERWMGGCSGSTVPQQPGVLQRHRAGDVEGQPFLPASRGAATWSLARCMQVLTPPRRRGLTSGWSRGAGAARSA
jgi:hypothetical protein